MSGGGDFVAEGLIYCENEINVLKVTFNDVRQARLYEVLPGGIGRPRLPTAKRFTAAAAATGHIVAAGRCRQF